MATAIAVVCALTAAFCFAVGSLVQQGVARESGAGALRLALLLHLVRQPRWIGGVALDAFSFVIQGVALAFGPLTLVQPIAATDVLFALPLIARRQRRRITRHDALGALTVTAGIVIFLAVSPPAGGVAVPPAPSWVPALLAVGAMVAVSGVMALRARGRPRVIWLAAAAGALYGLLDALTKSTVDLLADDGAATFTHWEPYALLATGVLGALYGQSAFGAGALSLSLPVIDTLEPVAAVVIGATVFGERLAASPAQFALQLAGGAAAVVGIAILARSQIVAAETRDVPGLATSPPGTSRDHDTSNR